jgi:hypothetical protein
MGDQRVFETDGLIVHRNSAQGLQLAPGAFIGVGKVLRQQGRDRVADLANLLPQLPAKVQSAGKVCTAVSSMVRFTNFFVLPC